jgi:hypothetical protein
LAWATIHNLTLELLVIHLEDKNPLKILNSQSKKMHFLEEVVCLSYLVLHRTLKTHFLQTWDLIFKLQENHCLAATNLPKQSRLKPKFNLLNLQARVCLARQNFLMINRLHSQAISVLLKLNNQTLHLVFLSNKSLQKSRKPQFPKMILNKS